MRDVDNTSRRSGFRMAKTIYRRAFAGAPWFEKLTTDEVNRRWSEYRRKRGFGWLACVERDDTEENKIVKLLGMVLWDTPTVGELWKERGPELARFAADHLRPGSLLVWEREIFVDLPFQNQGICTLLRREYPGWISDFSHPWLYSTKGLILMLTRMRDDNAAVIKSAEKVGFKRTGIRIPSSQVSGIYHEYWFREVKL